MFCEKAVLTNFIKFPRENPCWSYLFNEAADLQRANFIQKKICSATGVFLLILQIPQKNCFKEKLGLTSIMVFFFYETSQRVLVTIFFRKNLQHRCLTGFQLRLCRTSLYDCLCMITHAVYS